MNYANFKALAAAMWANNEYTSDLGAKADAVEMMLDAAELCGAITEDEASQIFFEVVS